MFSIFVVSAILSGVALGSLFFAGLLASAKLQETEAAKLLLDDRTH